MSEFSLCLLGLPTCNTRFCLCIYLYISVAKRNLHLNWTHWEVWCPLTPAETLQMDRQNLTLLRITQFVHVQVLSSPLFLGSKFLLPEMEAVRQGQDTRREEVRQHTFNKMRHPFFGAVILKVVSIKYDL